MYMYNRIYIRHRAPRYEVSVSNALRIFTTIFPVVYRVPPQTCKTRVARVPDSRLNFLSISWLQK